MKFIVDSILFSYSQIFFCNRRWFGLTALAATLIIPEIGFFGLAGVVISNFIALFLKYDTEKIRNGFYGFNALLFGLAVAYFFEITPYLVVVILIFIIITFFISATLEHFLANVFNLPGLSLPFIISLYIFFIFITNYSNIFYKGFSFTDYEIFAFIPSAVQIYFKSIGLILFQSSIISGFIITVAIIFFSRVLFLNSIIAFALNYLFVQILLPDASSDLVILTSFNSILASFALGGSLVIISRKSMLLIIVSTMMIIVFSGFFVKVLFEYLLPVLVLPFNFVVLFTIYSLKFRQEHSDLTLLYFQPGSPEENFYYHQNRKTRFAQFKNMFPELPVFGEWKITQGFNGKHTHKKEWQYAWDFSIVDGEGKEFENNGNMPEDYYCYNTPVAAPLSGEVVKVIDNVPENKIGETNLKNNWGNTVIMNHGSGLFSSLSHLKMNSLKVAKGDLIKKGDIVALCGSNGRSPIPHLHFQFQLTDKLGDKTFQFPISHFLEKIGNTYELKSFAYPEENSIVRNIETHKGLVKAFDLQLGDEFELSCSLNGKNFTEKWNVKVDIQNNMFIESDHDAKVYLYPREKVFYISNFVGNNKSALYYFYLQAVSIPLGYVDNLVWKDSFPVTKTVNKYVKYIAETLLLFGNFLESTVVKRYERKNNGVNEFIIFSDFSNKGKGLLRFYKEEAKGKLTIDAGGVIKEYQYNSKKINFKANINVLEV